MLLHDKIVIVIVFIGQSETFVKDQNRHVTENPQIQDEVVNSIHNKHIQSDVLDPVSLFYQQQGKQPWWDNKQICDN